MLYCFQSSFQLSSFQLASFQLPASPASSFQLPAPASSSQLPSSQLPSSLLPVPYVPMLRSIRITLEMIKWEHSIFALPFALTGAMLAAHGFPPAAPWLARSEARLDRPLHDLRPLRRHGLQSLGRRRSRRRQPPHQHARHPRRPAHPQLRRRIHARHVRRSSSSARGASTASP